MNAPTPRHDPAAEEQAALWAARLDGSVLSAEDRLALDAWLDTAAGHRALLSSYCQFSADLEQQLPLIAGNKDEADGARTAPETALPSPWLRWPLWAGAALTAAAAVTVLLWVNHPRSQHENLATPTAQRQELTLADGSHVELNAQTSLRIDLGAEARHLRLAAGEAFFRVTKDPARPFIVETPAGAVRVTGTQFNVRAESATALEVTVAEGTVQVRPSDPAGRSLAPVVLTAREHLAAAAGQVHVQTLSERALADQLAWRSGEIVFTATPLREALARFARYHGRGLTATPAASELKVGGRHSLDDLDGFLASLEEVLPVKITRDLSGTVQVSLRSER